MSKFSEEFPTQKESSSLTLTSLGPENHSLLRCNSQQFEIQNCSRYYNRDLMTVLKFRPIYWRLAREFHDFYRPMDLRRTATN